MSYLVKLVRDHIPRLLEGEGTTTYRPVPREEHVKLLRGKLIEEALEYVLDPSVGELADVLAVARALAIVDLRTGWHAVQAVELEKHGVRGGFVQGIGMYVDHPSDPVKWPA
jgi:predicted house-cleaning noncanonical NTP pyrophosphatase (MazG superfamily)